MPIFELSAEEVFFPPAYLADRSGILAIGGDLSPQRLLLAYQMGIFPWFNPDDEILWWSPDPRWVIYPAQINISKSMRQLLKQHRFRVTFDQNFLGVIEGCRDIYRPGQGGTWISDEIIDSYLTLWKQGFIHSVEVWDGDALVGGLYGGNLGKCFFGESMFAKASNASKYGFIMLAMNLAEQGYSLIDCQVHTPHLESLGAVRISRSDFLNIVQQNARARLDARNWQDIMRTDFW